LSASWRAEFEHGLARQDGFGALRSCLGRASEVGRGVGEAVAVGGDHAQLAAVGDQQQAVEVVADVLLRHGVLHQGELALEGAWPMVKTCALASFGRVARRG
jgi:hypothetical protein